MVYWFFVAAFGVVIVILLVAAQKRHRANRAMLLQVTQSSRDQTAELTELSGQVEQLLQTLHEGIGRLEGNPGSSSPEFNTQGTESREESGRANLPPIERTASHPRQDRLLPTSLFAEPLVAWHQHVDAISSGRADSAVLLEVLALTARQASHRENPWLESREPGELMRHWWDESLRSSSAASPWLPGFLSSIDTQAELVRARRLMVLLTQELAQSLEHPGEDQTSRRIPRPWGFYRSRVYKPRLIPKGPRLLPKLPPKVPRGTFTILDNIR